MPVERGQDSTANMQKEVIKKAKEHMDMYFI